MSPETRALIRDLAEPTPATLLARLEAAGLGCPDGCSCRGAYEGPERRVEPRHDAPGED